MTRPSESNSRRVAILQSAYIPWRGYFDLIASVDTFIFLDDVRFNREWRNRNIIKTSSGPKWLTIPIARRGNQLIEEVEASDPNWGEDHWNRIVESYRRATYFDEVASILHPIYSIGESRLSSINANFITAINNMLGIATSIRWSTDYPKTVGKTQRLVDLCIAEGASVYVTGPAAKDYLDESLFNEASISVEWFSYARLAPYPQLYGPFEPAVSAIDLLFNCGPDARGHIPTLAH